MFVKEEVQDGEDESSEYDFNIDAIQRAEDVKSWQSIEEQKLEMSLMTLVNAEEAAIEELGSPWKSPREACLSFVFYRLFGLCEIVAVKGRDTKYGKNEMKYLIGFAILSETV